MAKKKKELPSLSPTLPIDLSPVREPALLTALGGLPLVAQTFRTLKLHDSVERHVEVKQRSRIPKVGSQTHGHDSPKGRGLVYAMLKRAAIFIKEARPYERNPRPEGDAQNNRSPESRIHAPRRDAVGD